MKEAFKLVQNGLNIVYKCIYLCGNDLGCLTLDAKEFTASWKELSNVRFSVAKLDKYVKYLLAQFLWASDRRGESTLRECFNSKSNDLRKILWRVNGMAVSGCSYTGLWCLAMVHVGNSRSNVGLFSLRIISLTVSLLETYIY